MYLDIGDLTVNIAINEALCTMLQVNHNRLIRGAKSQLTQLQVTRHLDVSNLHEQ